MVKTYKRRKKTKVSGYRAANFSKKKAAVPVMPKPISRIHQHKT